MSNSSSDSVDLSLSFSVSSVESEEYEASEVKGDLENGSRIQQSQLQRQEMTTLETRKGSTAETGKNLNQNA